MHRASVVCQLAKVQRIHGILETYLHFSVNWLNLLLAKLCNLNFHPLEVVSRYRDPQLQVKENYSFC